MNIRLFRKVHNRFEATKITAEMQNNWANHCSALQARSRRILQRISLFIQNGVAQDELNYTFTQDQNCFLNSWGLQGIGSNLLKVQSNGTMMEGIERMKIAFVLPSVQCSRGCCCPLTFPNSAPLQIGPFQLNCNYLAADVAFLSGPL